MVFTASLSELTEDHIRAIVDRKETEQTILDYKLEIEVSKHHKFELAKDVSAFANSQGGWIIIGIPEEDGVPKPDFQGVTRTLNGQKTDEWIHQVINSSISPRAPVEVKSIELKGSENVLIVIRIRESRRAPHMVTVDHDNRYYRRHGTESLRAEEYEVRELFERGARYMERTERYLKERGYHDPYDPGFGMNNETRRLRYWKSSDDSLVSPPFFTFSSLPIALEPNTIDTDDVFLLSWLDPNKRRYQPRKGDLLYSGHWLPTFEGLICPTESGRGKQGELRGYMIVNRNGYVEHCPEGLVSLSEDRKWFVSLEDTEILRNVLEICR
jgi:hypothetical protein